MSIRLAVDAMGGDRCLSATVPASIRALSRCPNLHLTLVGDETKIQPYLSRLKPSFAERLEVRHASEVVHMDEGHASALRKKKDSSMRVSINLLEAGDVDAVVSAGNTGALMATARYVLKTIPGVDRPAIIYALPGICPTSGNRVRVHMLDLGANVECTSDHLFQFGVMGSLLVSCVEGIESPRVRLLNIGQEDIKGLDTIKRTAERYSSSDLINYEGFIEGNEIFTNRADVIVCDGFVGNVALKTIEGMATFVKNTAKHAVKKSWFSRACATIALPAFRFLKKDLDLSQYNGATLLGLNGVVVKSHGSANADAFETAIHVAIREVRKGVLDKVRDEISQMLDASQDTL